MDVHKRVAVGLWEEPYDRVSSGVWLLKGCGDLAAQKTCSEKKQEALEMRARAVWMCPVRQWQLIG